MAFFSPLRELPLTAQLSVAARPSLAGQSRDEIALIIDGRRDDPKCHGLGGSFDALDKRMLRSRSGDHKTRHIVQEATVMGRS